jgi:hypothetical protein
VRVKKCLVWVTGGVYFAWFFLAAYSDRVVEVVSRYIPGWFAALAIASWLVLIPITEHPPKKPKYLQISLGVLFVISYLLVPVAGHFYPSGTVLIGGLLCVEVFWLVPRWKKKWSREVEPE